ncbi:MAG: type II CAAX endopeptidase family protein [Holophaga sp.]|nr:type II CAAX endopeptidase family protein [Holophaga sp.]
MAPAVDASSPPDLEIQTLKANFLWDLLKRELGRDAFPGLLQALVMVWLIGKAQPILAYLIAGPFIRLEWYGMTSVALATAVVLSSLSAPLLGRFWGQRRFREMLALRSVPWRSWPSIVVGALGIELFTICLLLVMLQTKLISIDPSSNSPGDGMYGGLLAIVGAPIWEEFVFRGIILGGFLKHYPKWFAILASAILFGAGHGNLGQFVSAGTFGLFAGWLFVETGSLWPCLFAHAFGNTFVSAAPDSLATALGLQLGGWPATGSWFLAMGLLALGIVGLLRTQGRLSFHDRESLT